MADEEWRPVLGFEDYYEVSDLGRVRTIKRKHMLSTGRLHTIPSRIRKLTSVVGNSGAGFYLAVSLKVDGVETRCYVHILVLDAFRGPRLADTQTRHLNGIKNDNRLSNLCWGTRRQNAADRIAHGTHPVGSRNGFARLHETDIPIIRAAYDNGIPVNAIARRYAVGRMTIFNVIKRNTWTHV